MGEELCSLLGGRFECGAVFFGGGSGQEENFVPCSVHGSGEELCTVLGSQLKASSSRELYTVLRVQFACMPIYICDHAKSRKP